MSPIFYIAGFILFFISLFSSRYLSYPYWVYSLYVLIFSTGYLTWVIVAGFLKKIEKFKLGYASAHFLSGILLLFAGKFFLPPLPKSKPDPFVVAPVHFLDWHLIFNKTFSLPFFIFSTYLFAGIFYDFIIKSELFQNLKITIFYALTSVAGILASIYVISLFLPDFSLYTNLAVYFLLVLVNIKLYAVFNYK